MNCDESREALLEVALPLVQGEGNEALVNHLAECANCSAFAAALEYHHVGALEDYRELRPRMSAEAMANAVLEGATVRTLRPAAASRGELRGALPRAARKRRGVVAAAFLGAAVAAAVTIFVVHNDAVNRSAERDKLSAESVPIDVEVPENQNAIVFATRNPKITVVWLYSGD